ncbi:MAG: O-antigen ligase C-terminal domain-containing protein [Ideonella sp.]|nr:O-antigen ligase C-terminal domain-containing protein [Ideonella sp.]
MRQLLLAGGLGGLVLGWNMPNHYPLWTSFHGELAAVVALSLLFGGLSWPASTTAATTRVAFGLSTSARLWLVLAAIPVLQYAAGMLAFRGDAALGLLYGLGVVLALHVGRMWVAQVGFAQAMRWLWTAFVFAALIAFGLALAQWLRLPAASWWAMELIESRPFANFAQPNHFGLAMVLGIVAGTALFELRELRHRATLALLFAAFGWGLLISQSRASLLALWLLALAWFATRRRVATRLAWPDLLVALAVGSALYFAVPAIEEALYLRAAELRSPVEVGPRELIWRHFAAAIAERPWLGYGFGQGVMALAEVATQVAPSRNTIYAHNVALDLMTWVGVPLALLLCLALAWWMLSWLRTGGVEAGLAAQRHLVFAAWLALAVQSMLEFPYAYTYFLLPAALLAGAVGQAPPLAERSESTRFVSSRGVMALAALAAALVGLLAYEYLQLEDDFRANRFERYRFINRPEHTSLEHPLVLDQLAALNSSSHFELRAGMPPEQIEQLHRLARRFHLLPTRIDYAKALALNGRAAEAEHELRIIRSAYPPAQYERIERDWRAWQQEHRDELTAPH